MTPLALTQGDPSGIGPDVTLRAWLDRGRDTPPFYVLADPAVLVARADLLGLSVPVAECAPDAVAELFDRALPVVPLVRRAGGRPGHPSLDDAGSTVEAIETAASHVRSGHASAVVTNPIAKEVLYGAGFAHPGHTEFLGELAGRFWGVTAPMPVMMLWSDALAVVPVTIHVALAAIPTLLSGPLIECTVVTFHRALRDRFGLAAPRLAVAGLNPHAGEGGAMGREEIDVIVPAIRALRARGLDVTGPFPADTLFTTAARPTYDAAVTMYHDQALIPIKTLAFDDAVNVTLGLPFVRTSPDHGTAFGIAGTGQARAASLQAALRLAGRLATADRRPRPGKAA